MVKREGVDPSFEDLLTYLKATRGFDFTGYKRPSLIRRVRKRLDEVKIGAFGDYRDYLEVHPDEFAHLFDTILINVTTFFRDPGAWDALREQALKAIVSARDEIRVWSAGCASGEEAYSIAIMLADALGIEDFKKRVKIYATDVDDDALAVARHGSYSVKDVGPIPVALRDRFFESTKTRYVFRPDLRRSIIFGHHDLLQDAPISRLNLLICRNTLMYFNAETQARVLANFHFALNDDGFLFLGRAETLLSHSKLFVPLDARSRLFAKVARAGLRERMLAQVTQAGDVGIPSSELRAAASDVMPVAQIVVDIDGTLVVANEQARAVFGIASRDIGRPLQDLEISYRPFELRSRIEEAYTTRRPVVVTNVERRYGEGETQYLDVQVAPVLDVDGSPLGVNVSYLDTTKYWKLRMDLERSNQDLETAYEELQSTNEELETTNEELQSTNEELETMNEELQSTNSELHALNDELTRRTDELNELTSFSESVLTNLRAGLVVVDENLRIRTWTGKTSDLWGLRADEVLGQSFLGLDIGLPVKKLRDVLRACLAGQNQPDPVVLDARDRLGRSISCSVTCSPLLGSDGRVVGAIVVMDGKQSGDGD